jgi:carbon monoxide dehydrogenase subunit G
MKITGDHDFTASRGDVWRALQDPDALAATLPGTRRLERTGPDEYAMTVDVGVGAVKGTFDGTFALTDKQEPESCTVRARASGRPGSVSVVARMDMTDDAVLTYEADATVTGPLAGVGQRLMAAAARRTTEQFLTALDAHIAAPQAAEAPSRELAAPAPPRGGTDPKLVLASALGGFLLALVGVAVGRWSARR